MNESAIALKQPQGSLLFGRPMLACDQGDDE